MACKKWQQHSIYIWWQGHLDSVCGKYHECGQCEKVCDTRRQSFFCKNKIHAGPYATRVWRDAASDDRPETGFLGISGNEMIMSQPPTKTKTRHNYCLLVTG